MNEKKHSHQKMEEEAPIIYGLEFPARALAAQQADTDVARFFVGTQSLKFDNQVHLLEFDDDSNSLTKTVFQHSNGEIWHLSTSPSDPNLLATCYNQVMNDGKCEMNGAIWKLPNDSKSSDGMSCDEASSSLPSLELVAEIDNIKGSELKSIVWEPNSGARIASLMDMSLSLWSLQDCSQPNLVSTLSPEQKGRPKFTSARWNPHHNCNTIATAVDISVRAWDIRSMKQCWSVENAHMQLVRELDFNPNKQYYLATCGDDCQTKFWDIRNSHIPLMTLHDHSHWVWSVRYNNFHDELVLTSSSDSRVILSRAVKISSGRIADEEDGNSGDKELSTKPVPDGVISIYEEHEDSVYAAEWSSADAWLFASLSYDGRLIINKVPRSEKYRILL